MVPASCCEASVAIYQQTRRQVLSWPKRLDCLYSEDGGKKHPWNVGKLLTKVTASCPRRRGRISVKYIVAIGFSCSLLPYCRDREADHSTFVGKTQNYRLTRFNTADFSKPHDIFAFNYYPRFIKIFFFTIGQNYHRYRWLIKCNNFLVSLLLPPDKC